MASAGSLHLLVVDDEDAVLRGLARSVRRLRPAWRISCVRSVHEARALVAGGGVDAVLTDVHMPGESGLALLAFLRSREEYAAIPAVVFTGDDDEALRRRILGLGAIDICIKPVAASELVHTVESAVSRRRSARRRGDYVPWESGWNGAPFPGIADERRGALASGMGHELFTPLTSIRAAAEILRSLCDDDTRREFAEIVLLSARRLTASIGELLTFALLEAGESAERERVGLEEIATRVRDELEEAFRRRGQSVSFCLDAGKGAVFGSGRRIALVLRHLLENASAATPAGGRIRVVSQTRGDARRDETSGEWIRVCVEDEGPGLPPRIRAAPFAPFAKDVEPCVDRSPGLGIGLAICRAAIESMGGIIGVEPRDGGGTRFWFELPAVPGDSGSAEPTANGTERKEA